MRPKREIATSNGQTYFVTSNSADRKPFFRHQRWAELFVETLYSYRPERYLLHAFVLMPDHFHIMISPTASLELAVQCIKGGFSFRAKRELGWMEGIWIAGFSDHRIRDDAEFQLHFAYINRNPVKAALVELPEQYAYGSANGQFELDAFPQGLKPETFLGTTSGAAKAVPFQSGGGPGLKPSAAELSNVPAEAPTLHAHARDGSAALVLPIERSKTKEFQEVEETHATQK